MAVKLAHALGAEVTLVSTSPEKRLDAKHLGADEFILSRDAGELAKSAGFDSLSTRFPPLTISLPSRGSRGGRARGSCSGPAETYELAAFELIMQRRSIAGLLVGGLAETQEMLDFCAQPRDRRRRGDDPDAGREPRL
jgi:alcohol dehydrogenase (NADP+)